MEKSCFLSVFSIHKCKLISLQELNVLLLLHFLLLPTWEALSSRRLAVQATLSPPLAVPTAEAGRQWRQGRTGPTDLFGGNTDITPGNRAETKGIYVFINGLDFLNRLKRC